MRSANLDPKVNHWSKVFDFNDEHKVANHWRLWDEAKEVGLRSASHALSHEEHKYTRHLFYIYVNRYILHIYTPTDNPPHQTH